MTPELVVESYQSCNRIILFEPAVFLARIARLFLREGNARLSGARRSHRVRTFCWSEEALGVSELFGSRW